LKIGQDVVIVLDYDSSTPRKKKKLFLEKEK
jgi:hypothetical protein